jgi:hypothetical protein
MQIVDARDGVAPESDNHVSLEQSGALGRTFLGNPCNQHSGFLRQVVEANQAPMQRNRLRFYPYVRTLDPTMPQ